MAATQNITKAAEKLYTGQPSVSKAIKKLEEALQTTLFIRSPKGVVLTADGKLLFKHIEKALREIQAAETAVKKNSARASGRLVLGVSAPVYKFVVLPYLKDFLQTHPNIVITIADNSKSYEVLEGVKSGLLDIAVVTKPPARKAGLEFVPVTRMEEVVVAAPRYLERFDLSKIPSFLEKAAFISIDKNRIMRDYSDLYLKELAREFGVEVKPEIETGNMNFIIELVGLEVGIGIVYRQFIERELQDGKLVALDFLPRIKPREICIALKKGALRTHALKEFMQYYSNASLKKLNYAAATKRQPSL